MLPLVGAPRGASRAEAFSGELRTEVRDTLEFVADQVRDTIDDLPSTTSFPRSTGSDGKWDTVSASDWTSGFFPALLWQMYRYTAQADFLSAATSWSTSLSSQATRTDTHDVGFMVGIPASLAYELTGKTTYRNTLLTAARSLATRYDPDVGATRSWSFGSWSFPVIIDNVVNLELLLNGAELTTNGSETSSWNGMVDSHAEVTADEHIRNNGSTYHLVDFNPSTGAVIERGTHAGAGDETTWARGQAWGIYGYAMLAERTGDASNLNAARDLADYFLDNLPADNIPWWDFDAGGSSLRDKDSSAAAIATAGLLRLATLTSGAEADRYFDAASDILETLMSSTYRSNGSNSAGLLLHVTGNRPRNSEIDVSTIYADYFFTEALLRYLDITPSSDAPPTVAITTPPNGAIADSPLVIAGTAADATGVTEVLLSIQDQVTGRFWNGTSFQPTLASLNASLSSPGGASTNWSYTFDLGSTLPSAQPYVLSVRAIDTASQPSLPETRTFSVRDALPPVIDLIGPNPLVVPLGGAYVERGAVANDNVDGDVTGSIVINAGAVNTALLGSYSVTYSVLDSSSNRGTATRTVNVVDVTRPIISLAGSPSIVLDVGDPFVDPGATASDDTDGNITGSIDVDSNVNTNVAGGYRITYNVEDAAGNEAVEKQRTVLVVGSGGPSLALKGANPQVITVGGAYTDLGASARDEKDGNLTPSIVVGGDTVNASTIGTYSVTYNVTDNDGNAAPQVTRTVQVVASPASPDTTPPVITLNGVNPVLLAIGDPTYVDAGATALDNVDGSVAVSFDDSVVNTSAAGAYTVAFSASDSSGNSSADGRAVLVAPVAGPPVMALKGANPQVIRQGDLYADPGAAAADGSGDISGTISVGGDAVDTSTTGIYLVTYDVSNGSGAAPQVTRTVQVVAAPVVDTTPPGITLSGNNPVVLDVGASYNEPGASVTDDIDPSPNLVVNNSSVNTSVAGGYTVTYTATDAAGNIAREGRAVLVVGSAGPVMALAGPDPYVIPVGGTYVEYGADAADDKDGSINVTDIDDSDVNTSKVGSYDVTYDVSDSDGNPAPTLTRTVQVVDVTPPVISLIGPATQVVGPGAMYAELGATATDDVDGDVSASVVADSTGVDDARAGRYLVTYDVSDDAGNAAETVWRVVAVASDDVPFILLTGPNPQRIAFGNPYVELGATATDGQDGDLTPLLTIDATDVDTSEPGSYRVQYSVVDSGGNLAVAFRTVEVVDFFFDDNASIFQRDVNAIALADITRGCNPPLNDRYCGSSNVTRGQFAALMNRALNLAPGSGNPFTDDDDSIFENDIEALYASGITRGCNPPANTRFCPDQFLTRGQAAAFFVRAFGYVDNGGGDLFIDDDDSIFENDIDKLATAGVTRGCNPPANTEFCPENRITRYQIAAFLARALGL
ncbi:MAG: DUF5011 domain-containing protein [Acidimicrobiia bacterium]|nr:DUF5011 domain-containing protein [Acidimicrobiia bacterium]